MKQGKSFSRGMLSAAAVILLFSLIIVGCKKESQREINLEEIIKQYKSELFKDNDFIENYKLDRIITDLNKDKNLIIDENKSNSLLKSIKEPKSLEELNHAFASHGYTNSAELIRLFNLKASALINVQKRFPYLSHLTKEELKSLFMYSYERVIIETKTNYVHRPGCSNNCCDAYVDGMSDCDLDFTIATGLAFLGGAAATIFGTPIAGAAAVSTGIGGAYLMHERCSATTARTYRQCMGYPR